MDLLLLLLLMRTGTQYNLAVIFAFILWAYGSWAGAAVAGQEAPASTNYIVAGKHAPHALDGQQQPNGLLGQSNFVNFFSSITGAKNPCLAGMAGKTALAASAHKVSKKYYRWQKVFVSPLPPGVIIFPFHYFW